MHPLDPRAELARTVSSPLTPEMLRPLGPRCHVVQFAPPLDYGDYEKLAAFLLAYPDVKLRVYAYGGVRDLGFLRWFGHVRRFQADLGALTSLDGLAYLRPDLTDLTLGKTAARLSLAPLARFTSLRTLYLESHIKDIEVVSGLTSLRSVTLRSITLPDLAVLTPLTGLRALDLKLGGTRDLGLLPKFSDLRYLEVWQVRAFDDLEPMASTPSIEAVHLQALKNVMRLPAMHAMTRLRSVWLETMKGLRDLSPLLAAPALEQVSLVDFGHLQPADVAVLARHPTLRRANVGLNSARKNAEVARLLPLADGWEPVDQDALVGRD